MSSVARVVGLLAIAALLFLGAVGLSGHLVGEDHCLDVSAKEGTFGGGDNRWAPPGYECVFQEPSGTTAEGRFLYEDGWQRGGRVGSWPAFLGALLAGFGIVGLALRRRPDVPTWLRLAAVTTLAFAVAGAGAFVGGWNFSVFVVMAVGVPVAFAADRWLRPGRGFDHPWTAGPAGAAVAFSASLIASTGWLFGLGVAAYGLTILLVAAVAALPWWRFLPWPVPAR